MDKDIQHVDLIHVTLHPYLIAFLVLLILINIYKICIMTSLSAFYALYHIHVTFTYPYSTFSYLYEYVVILSNINIKHVGK